MQRLTIYLYLFIVSVFLLAGCSSTPPTNSTLMAAEQAVNRAEQSAEVSDFAPVPLREAQDYLQQAQSQWQEEGNEAKESVDHLAYLAEQKALLALERAQLAALKENIDSTSERRDELVLQSRERELQRAKQQAQQLQSLVEELEAKQTERGMVLTIDDILFDFDKAALNPGGRKAVEYLAEWLQENPDRNILIEGHTDALGSENYNQQLSKQRAVAVEQTLIDYGVPRNRIQTTGYGEQYPVANNSSSAGRQQNRRVEVVVADAGEMPQYREDLSQTAQ